MSKLHTAFFRKYQQWIVKLQSIFTDFDDLAQEIERVQKAIDGDDGCMTVHTFGESADPFLGRIYDKDESVLSECPFTKRMGAHEIIEHLDDDEKSVFWQDLSGVIRYLAIVRACGNSDQMSVMEQVANKFIQKNVERKLKPQDYPKELIKDMLGGGEMSRMLLGAFSDKDNVKAVLNQVPHILRGMNAGDDELVSNLCDITSSFDDKDVDEIQSAVKDQLENGDDAQEMREQLSSMLESGSLPIDKLSDTLRDLTQK
jgi:hypothetical protein